MHYAINSLFPKRNLKKSLFYLDAKTYGYDCRCRLSIATAEDHLDETTNVMIQSLMVLVSKLLILPGLKQEAT
jgi:hypothetical protein